MRLFLRIERLERLDFFLREPPAEGVSTPPEAGGAEGRGRYVFAEGVSTPPNAGGAEGVGFAELEKETGLLFFVTLLLRLLLEEGRVGELVPESVVSSTALGSAVVVVSVVEPIPNFPLIQFMNPPRCTRRVRFVLVVL